MLSLSIIVPTKDRTEDLMTAVRSIIPQMEPTDELLVIDQSLLSTKLQVEKIREQIQLKRTEIRHFHCLGQVNSLVEAKHFGSTAAKGDVIVFLEDDIELCPNYLEKIRELFLKNDHLMGGCGVEKNRKVSFLYKIAFSLSHVGLFSDSRVGVSCDQNTDHSRVESRFLSGGISFFRTHVVHAVGFDTKNNFFALEDIDFSVRVVSRYGLDSVGIFPNICLVHHRSLINRAEGYRRWKRKIREFVIFFRKYRYTFWDDFSLGWLLFCLCWMSVGESIKWRDSGHTRGFVDGLFAGFSHQLSK